MVKSQKDLKGTKVFALECSVRNLKKFSKFTGILARVLSQQTFVLMKTSFVFAFKRHLDEDEYILINHTSSEDVFKTSWSRPIYSSCPYVFKASSRRFQDVFKMSCYNVFKTFSRRLQDVLQKRLQDVFKMSSTCFQDVFKTS